MPWTKDDASSHTKEADTDAKKAAWAKIANKALKDGKSEASAIKIANSAVAQMGNGKKLAEEQEDRGFAKLKSPLELQITETPPEMQVRFTAMAPRSYDAKKRAVEATLSMGSPVKRIFGTEKLDVSPQAIDLKRLTTSGVPVLDSHNITGIEHVLGRIDDVWFDKKSLMGRIVFADTESGRRAEGMVARGELTGISVGYRVDQWEIADENGRVLNPKIDFVPFDAELTYTGKRWELLEASLVSVPADSASSVRSIESSGNAQDNRSNIMAENIERAEEITGTAEVNELDRASCDGGSEVKKTARTKRSDNKKEKEDWGQEWNKDDRKEVVSESDKEKEEEEEEEDDKTGKDDKKASRAKRKDKADKLQDDGAARSEPGFSRADFRELAAIERQFRSHGVNIDLDEVIERGERPDELRKRGLIMLSKMTGNGGPKNTAVDVVRDEREGREDAMTIALTTRILEANRDTRLEYKPKNKQEAAYYARYAEQAEQYMGMGLVELAAECIGYRGRIITPSKSMDILTRAFQTTTDYPNIFQNALNKSLLARYELAAPTYRELAAERTFNDFRPHPQIRAGEFPVLQPLSETGELKYGATTDSGETISVTPYGVVFSISRTALVNDELGAIDQILGSAGDTVLVFENTTFFTALNANPTLKTDSLAVFHATHTNLAATGADPSIATIGAGRAAIRAQKSLSGLFLNLPPRIILTGPLEETVADQMVTTIAPTLTTSVNPFSGRIRSVSDANIVDKAWYLFGDPARVPSFVYGFLRGVGGPRVRTFEPFGVQGIKISLEHDFGVGAIDYRSVYKSPTF